VCFCRRAILGFLKVKTKTKSFCAMEKVQCMLKVFHGTINGNTELLFLR